MVEGMKEIRICGTSALEREGVFSRKARVK